MSYERQTFTNGQTLTHTHMNHIEQGLQDLSDQFDAGGAKGDPGEPGYTPIRGVDYWTEADKAEIKGYVDEAILGGEW